MDEKDAASPGRLDRIHKMLAADLTARGTDYGDGMVKGGVRDGADGGGGASSLLSHV